MLVSSLSQLHCSAEQHFGRPLFLPVDEEFVQGVHSHSLSGTTETTIRSDASTDTNKPFIFFCKQLFERARKRSAAREAPPGVAKSIFSYASEAVLGCRAGEFMGPLCSPIRKSHATLLRRNKYFVTEKSDGTRVILVSILAPEVPRWIFLEATDNNATSMRLDNVVALELAREQLIDSNTEGSVQVRLSGSVYSISRRIAPEDDTSEIFTLEETNSSKGVISLKRIVGTRHMSYCFDRSMDQAYLLYDDYVSPLLSFAVDGELMLVDKRTITNGVESSGSSPLFLGCFDVFRYKVLENDQIKDITLTRSSMSHRYGVLKDLILKTLRCSSNSTSTESPLLRIFAKELLPMDRIGECISRLVRFQGPESNAHVMYYYNYPHGLTKSDGFIFTPDDFDLVHGASKDQLKWKWPSMLSVDWSVTASSTRSGEYIVDMFFRKRRFGHRPDSVGRTRLSSSMRLLNPLGLPISSTCSVVVECVYNRSKKLWSIERLRQDKTEPNSVVTVISVLESMVENISLVVLAEMIQVRETLPVDLLNQLRDNTEVCEDKDTSYPLPEKKTCQCSLRATQLQTQGEHDIHLYWVVRLMQEKHHIPCIHCKIHECLGLGYSCPAEDESSKLTEILYVALANAGGSYAWSDFTVDAAFDGNTGRWNILSLNSNGDNKRSTCTGVIEHLQWLLATGCSQSQGVIAINESTASTLASTSKFNSIVTKTNDHYALKTKELSTGKNTSVIRRFNNWVKSLLITSAVEYIFPNGGEKGVLTVADLCSGRGGDLFKWRVHKPKALFMTDSCLEAVAEAAGRYCVSKGLSVKIVKQDPFYPGIPAYYCVCDAFDESGSLTEYLRTFRQMYGIHNGVDIVSCQFSIHYGCSSEERLSTFISAVSSALRPGGVFIGTTVNDTEILTRFSEKGPSFGNSVYNVRFLSESPQTSDFGVEYFVSVENSVSEMIEYIVPWERFIEICRSFQLSILESFGFLEYSDMHHNTSLGQKLRDALCGSDAIKRDADGHVLITLTPEEREAASLFRTFFFVKNE